MTGLTAIWAGVHLQLARLADCPAIAMSEAEARQFLIAWQNYLRHLSIAATQKTVDLVTAIGVTAFLYIPRGVAISERRRNGPPRPREAPQGPAQVFRFHPPPPPPGAASEAEILAGEAEPVH